MNIRLVISILLETLILESCCQKKECLSINHVNEIKLIGFDKNDVDSVRIKRYKANHYPSDLIDSASYAVYNRDNVDTALIVFMDPFLDITVDYMIIVKNNTYMLTHFSTKEKECNSCFPVGHDNVIVLNNYYVNGAKRTSENLKVLKTD